MRFLSQLVKAKVRHESAFSALGRDGGGENSLALSPKFSPSLCWDVEVVLVLMGPHHAHQRGGGQLSSLRGCSDTKKGAWCCVECGKEETCRGTKANSTPVSSEHTMTKEKMEEQINKEMK